MLYYGVQPSRFLAVHAASGGSVEILQWCSDRGLPICSPSVCAAAAGKGHLGALKWLRANNCPWSSTATEAAASNGHFELLKWAHANGAEWNGSVSAAAARRGDFEMLKWLQAIGCPCNQATCEGAAACSDTKTGLAMLKWLRDQGCLLDAEVIFNSAAHQGDMEILKWLFANGAVWNKSTCSWSSNLVDLCARLETFQWMIANGAHKHST